VLEGRRKDAEEVKVKFRLLLHSVGLPFLLALVGGCGGPSKAAGIASMRSETSPSVGYGTTIRIVQTRSWAASHQNSGRLSPHELYF